MTDEARVDVEPKYWGNVLSAFEAGVQMDLRLRLAMDFLKSPYFEGGPGVHPDAQRDAALALDLATALVEEAAARGMLKPMPETGEINAALRHHVERTVRVNAHGQITGQRIMREENSGVMAAGASIMHPGLNG